MTVNQSVQYVDSITVPTITVGTGLVSEVRCDEQVNTTVVNNASDYKGPYQYGEFAYWESVEEYPCDESVWGDLAGQKIRHHKFPDCRISPIIENASFDGTPVMEDVAIYPIGVKIDTEQIQDLISVSDLTAEQKAQIVGYKITRADRGVNKSIVAKGMLRNVNKYTKEEQDFFYPNYPYNDLNEDPFLLKSNNAWSKLSKQFTIEVFNLPLQPDGNNYVEIQYVNPDTNKIAYKKYDKIDTYYICSLISPEFVSQGIYNKMNHSASGSTPKEDTDAIRYVSDYDIYVIGWRVDSAAGYRASWNDIVEGEAEKWLEGPFGGALSFFTSLILLGVNIPGFIVGALSQSLFAGETVLVRVPAGELPGCSQNCNKTVGGKRKWEIAKIGENRASECKTPEPISSIEENIDLLNRQIFNSPETSFGQPFLGSILSLETVMYGGGKAHFVEVKENAKYQLISREAQYDALKAAYDVGNITGTFSVQSMFAVYNAQLTIWINEITKRNFARSFNSIASYNYSKPVPINLGVKNRNLDIKRYLIPEVLNVGEDDININNYNRETSVYLRATETIPIPDSTLETYHNITVKDRSRFTIGEKELCSTPEKEEPISVVSYYGALKNRFVNQYGQIYSYESIDTGFVSIFGNSGDDIIWGGDTFIGRFAYKTKVPFFIDNRVKFPDGSDIFYDEIGNIAYPKYWHTSRSILETYRKDDLKLTNFVSYKATNFDCPNDELRGPDPEEFDYINDDPENYPSRTYQDGYFYMFAYGVPSFYCESSYNLDLRTAFNNKEGDFWPHVSSGIPDEWVQEKNVPIVQDNTYWYNPTFSKQNKESVITNIPANWDADNEIDFYPFRAVYSDKQISNVNNRLNNWLIYRSLSYFDFPQNYGNLTALDSLQNAAILARFDNKSFLYNSLVTIDTSNPQAAYVGNPNLFANQPIDFADTDQGYIGSQHKFILKTPYGAVTSDAKRGHMFLINGTKAEDLSQYGSGMHRWFTAHLPFEITKYFPGVDIDNHFKGLGLHGVFDSNYERVIITKLDYIPLDNTMVFRDNKFYVIENNLEKEVFLIDSDYFCNVSWTISFNFNTKSWISFHSYLPNWYVGENNFFYSGLNYCPHDFDVLVGVKDLVIPTTTTTTTIPLTTTTSTTIAVIPPDCSFDATVEIPDCDIEGSGIYVNDPIDPPCKRPTGLIQIDLYVGYDYLGVSYDTTVSQEQACTGGNYSLLEEELVDLTMNSIVVDNDFIGVNGKVFVINGTTDCSVPSDGWYYTIELFETSFSVFRLENGIIVEIASCEENTTTTTTTTTLLPTTPFCFTGIYTSPDPLHPLGGVLLYEDAFGEIITISEIWDTDTINIDAVSIISTTGVIPCP